MTKGEFLETHGREPSAIAFMARALLPSPGIPEDGGLPRIVQRWSGVEFTADRLAAFGRATGLPGEEGVSILVPHVLGFRLQMALLTHRAYPLPIWSVLQIRNRLVRHRRIDRHERWRLETQVGAHRVVEKGIEIDLLSRLDSAEGCCWESEVTYFHRGRFGATRADAPKALSPAISKPTFTERFRMPAGGGWDFGKLTGDYNGIHCWSWYARRLGFGAAFAHPQRVAGLCMARLRGPDTQAQCLELWIKGPVYYGADVVLHAAEEQGGIRFGLSLDGETRPALVGRWRGGSIAAHQE